MSVPRKALTCECQDRFHDGRECPHRVASYRLIGREPVGLCPCCAHRKHMTPQRTPVPNAEKEACAAR